MMSHKPLLFICFVIAICMISQSTFALNYERSTATGTWVDGNWVDSGGGSGNAPATSDRVSVGTTNVPGSIGSATVNLGSSATIQSLRLGDTQSGVLNILDTGSLSSSIVSVGNGELNVQSGGSLSTSSLSVTGSNSSAVLNGLSTIGNISVNSGSTFTADSALTLSNSLSANNGSIILNANTSARSISTFNGSTLTINADTSTTLINGWGTRIQGGILNLDAGILSSDLWLHESGGVAPQINRNGGHVDLHSLLINGGSQMTLGAGDSVDFGISLLNGAELTVDTALRMGSSLSHISNSTLNLNQDLYLHILKISGNAATINRNNGAKLHIISLELANRNYRFNGTDKILHSVFVRSGSSFTADSALTLSSGHLHAENNGLIVLNANTRARTITAHNATLTINADTSTTKTYTTCGTCGSRGTTISGGVLNLNAGTLNIMLTVKENRGVATQINQNGGHVDLAHLSINGASQMTLGAGDIVRRRHVLHTGHTESIDARIDLRNGATLDALIDLTLTTLFVDGSSTFTFTQGLGNVTGLSVDNLTVRDSSLLDLHFDSAQSQSFQGLDWGLRLRGDKRSLLQMLIDDNMVKFSGGTSPVGIIYDVASFGNYTYLGYTTTVPLPASLPLMLFGMGAIGALKRRKFA